MIVGHLHLAVAFVLASAWAAVAAEPTDCPFERISAHVWVLHGSNGETCPRAPDHPATNIGAVVSDAGVVLVDPGGSDAITGLVLDRLAAITDQPVVVVINSHIHGPYWLGNGAVRARFPGVPIIAHARMIERLSKGEARFWAKTLDREAPPEVTLPDRALGGGATLTIGDIRLRLHVIGHAHTDHDLLVEIPSDRVLFLGGLVVEPELPSQGVPADADFRGQIAAIRAVLELPVDHFVPGRGRTAGKELPGHAARFLQALYTGVERYYDAGLQDYQMTPKLRGDLAMFRRWYAGPLADGYWIDAADLRAGDRLLNDDSSRAEVVSSRTLAQPLRAYNLTVKDFHTYFVAANENAAPVWVHNDCFGKVTFNINRLPAETQAAVNDTLSHLNVGTKPSGPTRVKWGSRFHNKNGDLPEFDANGSRITYKEYRVAPRQGVSGPGYDRIVVGSDGRRYYTGTHYGDNPGKAFVRIK